MATTEEEIKPPLDEDVPEPGCIELKEVISSLKKNVAAMNRDEVREELVNIMAAKYAPKDPTQEPLDQHSSFELAKTECRELVYEWEEAGIKFRNFQQMLQNARVNGGHVLLVHEPETTTEDPQDIPDTDLRVCIIS